MGKILSEMPTSSTVMKFNFIKILSQDRKIVKPFGLSLLNRHYRMRMCVKYVKFYSGICGIFAPIHVILSS